jgi:hypothetical protein
MKFFKFKYTLNPQTKNNQLAFEISNNNGKRANTKSSEKTKNNLADLSASDVCSSLHLSINKVLYFSWFV